MKPSTLLFALAAALAVTVAPQESKAWVKFKNDTPYTVWVWHAYASVDSIFCGFYDSCPRPGYADYRIKGWWNIARGGTATVDGENYGNAKRQFYAYTNEGYWWGGGGTIFKIRWDAYNSSCGDQFDLSWPSKEFRWYRKSRCCGGTCPSNHTVRLVL
jgi:hypothetical protein